MGPFEMQDMAGLNIAFRGREAARANGEDVPETLGDKLVRADRLGQKSGGDWYDYEPGSRKPLPSDTTTTLLGSKCAPAKQASAESIIIGLISTIVDEGQRILEEGIADSPVAIDLVQVHGSASQELEAAQCFILGCKKRA